MTKHFKNITNLEELKKAYRELAKKNHPDLGGSLETMKEINTEYELLFAKLNTDNKADINDGYREIIDLIINLNINIEVCGSWVWVSGDTYSVKNELKKAGFFWAAKKKMWYWRPEEAKTTYSKRSTSMQEIRNKYGSQIIKTFSKPSYSAIAGTC